MQIIYPADDFNSKQIDESYIEEAKIAKECGFKIGILDLNKFKDNKTGFSLVDKNELSLWRGWMFNFEDYESFSKEVHLLISPKEYLSSHHIINWYSAISELTPKSIFCNEKNLLSQKEGSYFVKDYVKSNTGKLGSISNNLNEANQIIQEIKKYRGSIEGGVCLREVLDIDINTESRYFVVNGSVISNDNNYPEILDKVVEKITDRSFYTVDVVQLKNTKEYIVIEIGDGQVSDIKNWSLNNFKNVLSELINLEFKNKNKIKL